MIINSLYYPTDSQTPPLRHFVRANDIGISWCLAKRISICSDSAVGYNKVTPLGLVTHMSVAGFHPSQTC